MHLSSFAMCMCVQLGCLELHPASFWFLYRCWSLQWDQRDQHLWVPATPLGHLYRCTCPRGAEEDSRERRGNFIFCHYYCLLMSVFVPLCVSPVGFAGEFCFSKASQPLKCKNCVMLMTGWVFWYACSKKKKPTKQKQWKKSTFLTASICCHFCNKELCKNHLPLKTSLCICCFRSMSS